MGWLVCWSVGGAAEARRHAARKRGGKTNSRVFLFVPRGWSGWVGLSFVWLGFPHG